VPVALTTGLVTYLQELVTGVVVTVDGVTCKDEMGNAQYMYRIQVAPGSFIDVQEAAGAIATTLNSPATTPCSPSSPPGFCTATGSNFSTAACAGQPYSSSSSSSTPLYCPSVGHSWALATKVPGITSCDTAYAASQVVKDGILGYVSSLVIDPVVLSLPELNVRCYSALAGFDAGSHFWYRLKLLPSNPDNSTFQELRTAGENIISTLASLPTPCTYGSPVPGFCNSAGGPWPQDTSMCMRDPWNATAEYRIC